MQETRMCRSLEDREPMEDLIDSLIAISLLTKQMAKALIDLSLDFKMIRTKEGNCYGKHERAGFAGD